MLKILYIGDKVFSPKDGAEQVNMRNQVHLEKIFSKNITYLSPSIRKSRNPLQRFYLGVTDLFVKEVLQELSNGCYGYVFISHSTMGRLTKKIKQVYPNVRVVVFFHNIEIQYAHEYYKTVGLMALPFYLAVKRWEKMACKFSDYNITLNHRDSKLLKNIYGRDVNLELPTSFEDRFCEDKRIEMTDRCKEQIDYLFVGVAFFANVHGIQWFIDNVMPKVSGHLYVIGKGMDKYTFKNLNERIHIYGFVDDLSYYYYNAQCVVSPIFVGGGMKTKTAEALMYGKTIIGTSESFEGYKFDDKCMCLCNTSVEFVEALKKEYPLLNISSRYLFNGCYNNESTFRLLKLFFEHVSKNKKNNF